MISILKDIVKKRVQKYKNAPSERNWTHLLSRGSNPILQTGSTAAVEARL